MKGKNIRKENTKKPVKQPDNHSNKISFTDHERGIDYYLIQDNYETIVCLKDTNEPVGIYKAASRSWKNSVRGLLTPSVKHKVYSLYI